LRIGVDLDLPLVPLIVNDLGGTDAAASGAVSLGQAAAAAIESYPSRYGIAGAGQPGA